MKQLRCTINGGVGISFNVQEGQVVPEGYITKVGPYYPIIGQSFNMASIEINGKEYIVTNVRIFKPYLLVYHFNTAAERNTRNVAKGKLFAAAENENDVIDLMRDSQSYSGFIVAKTGRWVSFEMILAGSNVEVEV